MANDGDGPYELEPDDPDAPAEQVDQSASSQPSGDAVPTEPLMDDLDEDADLEHDPEVERVLTDQPKAVEHKEPSIPIEPLDAPRQPVVFVKPAWDSPRMMMIFGGVLTAAAIVATYVNEDSHEVLRSVLSLYKIAVHTGTGVVAVIVSALLVHMKVGRLDKAAARMFVAVSAFMLVAHLDMNIKTNTVELLAGAATYVAVVAWLFRFKRDHLLIVSIAHLALVAVTQVGMVLSKYTSLSGAG